MTPSIDLLYISDTDWTATYTLKSWKHNLTQSTSLFQNLRLLYCCTGSRLIIWYFISILLVGLTTMPSYLFIYLHVFTLFRETCLLSVCRKPEMRVRQMRKLGFKIWRGMLSGSCWVHPQILQPRKFTYHDLVLASSYAIN